MPPHGASLRRGIAKSFALCAAGLALLSLSACNPPESPEGIQMKPGVQVLKRGNGAEPVTLDPHRAVSVPAMNILRDLFEGLVATAADGTSIPGAAARWETSIDGLQWRFELRRDARWSNGERVTAADFVAGLRRALDPATGSATAGLLAPILNARAIMTGRLPPDQLGVEAPDEYTVVVKLAAATPWLPELLSHPVSAPLYRPGYEKHGDDFAVPGRMVSNGPFHLSEWQPGQFVKLSANHNYPRRQDIAIDAVIYYPIENQDIELERFEAGELHWTADVPHHRLGWLERRRADELVITPRMAITWLGFNVTRPPFEAAPGLRRALAMAVDRDLIVRAVTGAGEMQAYGWVPPMDGYELQVPDWAELPRNEQVEQARGLYAAAGFSAEAPLELELLYPAGLNNRRLAIAVAAMWRDAFGVRTRLREEPFVEFLESRADTGTTMVFRSGWAADYADPYSFLGLFDSETGASDTGWRNVAYDELLQASLQALNPRRRLTLLAEAERLLLEDQPVVPLYFDVRRRLVRPEVRGWKPNPMDLHPSRHFYLAVAEQ
ncbi:peptide ABC transporter substrate-binding protein [Wenzhouxiangella sp. XN24]|uniref:peptide ABC transporter substrate-binding protein n=1 Tax=Wenzhouxiangella sp. XN24 TaxID=2713569 RepID=UPI0013EC4977|nr:peptide ABC transporter substrate-binding protein [Wenzhouxiangella sp. XN24]NGX17532.1 peptide ABC transporter substrate-binding protein [Wenzhouxiangella sp. XN24]